ncbi:MAG: cell division protein ZapA [Magnetococcales bacterium]|nr:cell division protein ZapA [Magnetococcales bacterium]
MSEFIEVLIHGQLLRLRAGSGTESDYIREVASYVDGVMKEISKSSSGLTHDRVAVMAAVRIADQLFQQRQSVEDGVKSFEENVGRLIESSDQFMRG